MMKKMILTVAAAAVVAVNAQAQTFAQVGEVLPISNSVEASGSNITYEWYYSAMDAGGRLTATAAIPSCSGVDAISCVVPRSITSGFTDGQRVNFYRRAIAQDCGVGNTRNTTPITVTFVNLVVNSVRWANFNSTVNAANQPVFSTGHAYDDYVMYQFNRSISWPVTGEITAGWNSIPDNGGNWDETANPVCPSGWRLPTQEEYQDMLNNSNPIGSIYVAANARGNSVPGVFIGPNASTCMLPNQMGGCIFLPAAGVRESPAGASRLRGSHICYWTSMQSSATEAFHLTLQIAAMNRVQPNNKVTALPVRCVQ